MKRLPYDYSRCVTPKCPLASRCLRQLSPGRQDGMQVFTAFPGGEDCHGFIDVMEAD